MGVAIDFTSQTPIPFGWFNARHTFIASWLNIDMIVKIKSGILVFSMKHKMLNIIL